jgi:hypothetical protein
LPPFRCLSYPSQGYHGHTTVRCGHLPGRD